MTLSKSLEQDIVQKMELGVVSSSSFRSVNSIKPHQMLLAQLVLAENDPLVDKPELEITLQSYDVDDSLLDTEEGYPSTSIDIIVEKVGSSGGYHTYRSVNYVIPTMGPLPSYANESDDNYIYIKAGGKVEFLQQITLP